MLRNVYISQTNCITPLGFDVASNVDMISHGISAIQSHENTALMKGPFYAAVIEDAALDMAFSKISHDTSFTRLEKMMLLALFPIVTESALNDRTGFIVSTTKGNVSALENATVENVQKAQLSTLAQTIATFFGFTTEPIVVSNACVSGILAVAIAKRLIQSQMYDQIYVVAGDEVTQFVLSGFNSFQAMSELPCKPYSIHRTGVTLGEAAAAVLVTSDPEKAKIKIVGESSINDANHISGPSRTGEGLVKSVENALNEAGLKSDDIDYISAPGTATPFNDEMEAIALNRLGLEKVPINSLKGFYGHTLGASGLLEAVIGIESVLNGQLFKSQGFDEIGVSQPINVIKKNQVKDLHYFLKTASGFGGCNTAVIFEKIIQ